MIQTLRGWIALHLFVAAALVFLVAVSVARIAEQLDNKPVFVLLEKPQVLTPYVNPGGRVQVAWRGYYRRACAGLRYTRWIGHYENGEERIYKLAEVPASAVERTKEAEHVFTWALPAWLGPGVYFWRSIELADCGSGVVHRNELYDAWFEVVDPRR